MTYFNKAVLFTFIALTFCLINEALSQNDMQFEYSIEKLEYPRGDWEKYPKASLNLETKSDSIVINQVVYWTGPYKPHLKREGDIIKIIFTEGAVSQLIEPFSFKARIANLTKGKYKLQFIYEVFECQYEGGENWESCSVIRITELIHSRHILKKKEEYDIEIK